MRVLVLGSNGQLGHSLKKQSTHSKKDFIFSNKKECNINNFDQTREYILKLKPRVIINCAAYTAVDKAENEIELADQTNHKAVKNLAIICNINNIILIHISTDYVFGSEPNNIPSPFKETCKTNPKSKYGRSKLNGEIAIIASGCSYLILRTSWIFSEFGNNFLKTMIKLGKKTDDLKIVSDQIGCPTYALDIANALIKIIDTIDNERKDFVQGIFHFAGKEPTSWFLFASNIFIEARKYAMNHPNKLIPIKTSEYPTPAPRPLYSVLSSEKIKKYYNIDAPSWKEGVKDSLKNLSDKR